MDQREAGREFRRAGRDMGGEAVGYRCGRSCFRSRSGPRHRQKACPAASAHPGRALPRALAHTPARHESYPARRAGRACWPPAVSRAHRGRAEGRRIRVRSPASSAFAPDNALEAFFAGRRKRVLLRLLARERFALRSFVTLAVAAFAADFAVANRCFRIACRAHCRAGIFVPPCFGVESGQPRLGLRDLRFGYTPLGLDARLIATSAGPERLPPHAHSAAAIELEQPAQSPGGVLVGDQRLLGRLQFAFSASSPRPRHGRADAFAAILVQASLLPLDILEPRCAHFELGGERSHCEVASACASSRRSIASASPTPASFGHRRLRRLPPPGLRLGLADQRFGPPGRPGEQRQQPRQHRASARTSAAPRPPRILESSETYRSACVP